MSNFTKSIVEDAALRDTPLPKFITGELRVKDVVRQIEEATA